MKILIQILLLISVILTSGGVIGQSSEAKSRPFNVGDIRFDASQDNADFAFCDSTKIRSGRTSLTISNGNEELRTFCLEQFEYSMKFENFSGFVTVRFLVNCQLLSDRFRVHSMHYDFSPQQCPPELEQHLIDIVSHLPGWKLTNQRYAETDFSKFINFKITDGNIEKIIL